jgi:hypothetical protein
MENIWLPAVNAYGALLRRTLVPQQKNIQIDFVWGLSYVSNAGIFCIAPANEE